MLAWRHLLTYITDDLVLLSDTAYLALMMLMKKVIPLCLKLYMQMEEGGPSGQETGYHGLEHFLAYFHNDQRIPDW